MKGPKRKFANQSYKKLLKRSIETGTCFVDDQFKPQDESIGSISFKNSLDVGKILWKRPRELTNNPHFLFKEKLGPSASIQFNGTGPNQWLIAGAIAIAQDKALIYKILPKEQYHFLHGIFKVWIWDHGEWTKIVIDDKLPTYNDKLIFSRSDCGTIFWLPLLEKAYAKLKGSYEKLCTVGNLPTFLCYFTGFPTEELFINEQDDEKEYFRLIAEELSAKSIVCLKTRNNVEASSSRLKNNQIYIVNNIKKPLSGTFRKTFKETPATIELTNSFTPYTLSLSIENFIKSFDSVTICHVKINDHKYIASKYARTDMQFSFDIHQNSDEVLIDLMQKSDSPDKLGFKIYKVELNRKYKIHNTALLTLCYFCESSNSRNIFRRVKLTFGRYVLKPIFANTDTNLLLRIYSQRVCHLKVLLQDMPTNGLLSFLHTKPPQYVSKVIVKNVTGIEKQDRFGTANPYLVIRCGNEVVKSAPVNDTLNPDFHDFSAIFYHKKFATIMIEVWHSSFFLNSFVGQVEIIPEINKENSKGIIEAEICGRKKGHIRPGLVRYEIITSENLKFF